VIVCVPTYDRPELFERCVRSVTGELPDALLLVFDDASPKSYAARVLADSGMRHHVRIAKHNHGRARFGLLWHTLLRHPEIRDAPANTPVWVLADDMVFSPGAGARGHALLTASQQWAGCVGLNAHTDLRNECWGLPAQPFDAAGERVAWQDGAFLTYAHHLPSLTPAPEYRPPAPNRGTGVWQRVSQRVHRSGGWWYRPYESLLVHLDAGVSVLNAWTNGHERLTHTRGA